MSNENGPYKLIIGAVEDTIIGPGLDETYGETICDDGAPECFVSYANLGFHEGSASRDAEVSALTAERDALKARVKEVAKLLEQIIAELEDPDHEALRKSKEAVK